MQVATTTHPDTIAKLETLTHKLFSYVRKDGKEKFFVGIGIETIFVSKEGDECATLQVLNMEDGEKCFRTFHVNNIDIFSV